MKSKEELDLEFHRKLQIAKESSKELQKTLENEAERRKEVLDGRKEK